MKNPKNLWKDIRDMDFTNNNYKAPAMMYTSEGDETHSGEDVPILANGPWAHLFTGVVDVNDYMGLDIIF